MPDPVQNLDVGVWNELPAHWRERIMSGGLSPEQKMQIALNLGLF